MPKHRSKRNHLEPIISADGDIYPKQSKAIKKRNKEAKPARLPNSEIPTPISGFNLAGRPRQADEKIGGIYQILQKHAKPTVSGDLNSSSYWQFRITSSNREWFRFNVDSLSMVLYGSYTNPGYATSTNASPAIEKAPTHALRALKVKPNIFFDPSVLATTFISSVDVSINNVPVPTNSNLCNFLPHYARLSQVFTHKAVNYASNNDQLKNTGNSTNPIYNAGAHYLDYGLWTSKEGKRIPIHLHGIFPFECTNRSRAALTYHSNDNLFFPPGTQVDIRVNLLPEKNKLIFTGDHLDLQDAYYTSTPTTYTPADLTLSVQDVSLSYETYILDEAHHLKCLAEFQKGMSAKYDYDIVYTSYQCIPSNQSYASNDVQISPYCALLYILFLPDHGLFFTPSQNKPPSAFSRFPPNCTKMKLKFNGIPLICDEIENPGIANNHTELSKRALFNYLVSKRLYNGTFEQFFPNHLGAMNQCFVVDMENQKSQMVGILNIETYYNASKSTSEKQILVFSIHSNGRAEAKLLNKVDYNYEWEFYTLPQ